MEISFRPTINHRILQWARLGAGLEARDVAQKLRMAPEKYESWETGEAFPTLKQLRTVAHILKRPLAAFFLPVVPQVPQPIKDFRTLPRTGKVSLPPALLHQIRKAQSRRNEALEIMEAIGEQPVEFPQLLRLDDDPMRAASKLRDFLNLPLEKQYRWEDERRALRAWRDSTEQAGALVFQASGVPVKVMRGFSISDKHLPVVVLNASDSVRARIFSLIHEFAHLLLADAGLCNWAEENKVEAFCNAVAGNALVPRDAFTEQVCQWSSQPWETVSDERLVTLSDIFKVSTQVVLRRLLESGFISQEQFRVKQRALEQAIAARARVKTKGGGPSPARKAVANNGTHFSRLVLNAYYGDVITASDVSRLLGVRLKHLHKIEEYVRT